MVQVFTSHLFHRRTAVCCLVMALCIPVFAQVAPPIPAQFQSLAAELGSDVSAFDTLINSNWDGVKSPVHFGAHLGTANSNLGSLLLDPGQMTSVKLQLDGLQALGARAIAVSINFPVFYPAFHTVPGEYDQYVAFYQQVVNEIRSRGLMLIVESRANFSDPALSNVQPMDYYNSLTIDQYEQQRMETCRSIAQLFSPDYISVITEPDTEAEQTGKAELNTVPVSTDMLNRIVAGIRGAGVTDVLIGAGVGTWHPQYASFIQSFVNTPVDYIDLHIYNVNRDFLTRAITIADMAKAYGKRVTMTEAWLQKESEEELSTYPPTADILNRNVFSFWAPNDSQFLHALVDFAFYKQLDFMTPFYSTYFQGYLDWDDSMAGLPTEQWASMVAPIQSAAMQGGSFTPTGLAWSNATIPAPDTDPPATPAPAVKPLTSSSLQVGWPEVPDNIGTAGYYVYRDGALLAQTAYNMYIDRGLADGVTHTYVLAAFDAHGNVSPLSAGATGTPPDVTPPSAPAGLTATAVSGSEIDLTWNASTDNVGVAGYRIFQGSSPAALKQVAVVTANSFAAFNLSAQTTYFFAVLAVDSAGNVSPPSSMACATTTDATPTTPGKVTAVAASSTEIDLTWSASASSLGIAGYKILRGPSTTALVQTGYTTSTAFASTGLTPVTTYYFAVIAVDKAGNVSSQSSPVQAATPAARPPAPGSLSGSAVNSVQANLIWSASAGGLTISGYRVYRGASAAGLSQIGTSTVTSFAATGLQPATTYYFAVSAVDVDNNESPLSGAISLTTPQGLPGAPGGMAATAVTPSMVQLSWQAATDDVGIAGYQVYRSTNGMQPTQIAYVTAPGYSDQGVAPATTYTYTVYAVDTSNQQGPGASVGVTTPPILLAPGNLTAEDIRPTQVILAWSAPPSNVAMAGYKVFGGTSCSALAQIGATVAPSYTAVSLTPKATYCFAVSATDSRGTISGLSAPVMVTTP